MSLNIEYTDTFGGEANYCWVHRWHCDDDLTDAQLVRLAKRLAGLTGHPCKREDCGGMITLRPRGMCRILFAGYAERPEGRKVDRDGNDVLTDDEKDAGTMRALAEIELDKALNH